MQAILAVRHLPQRRPHRRRSGEFLHRQRPKGLRDSADKVCVATLSSCSNEATSVFEQSCVELERLERGRQPEASSR
jgi:hypothetical protein